MEPAAADKQIQPVICHGVNDGQFSAGDLFQPELKFFCGILFRKIAALLHHDLRHGKTIPGQDTIPIRFAGLFLLRGIACHMDPEHPYFLRQTCFHAHDPIHDVHFCQCHIGSGLELERQAIFSRITGFRRQVEQIIQSVHFRFNGSSHGNNDFFRSGTRISCCNKNGWLFPAHTPAQNDDPEDCRCKQKQPFHTVSFRWIDNCSKSFFHTIVPHDEKIK